MSTTTASHDRLEDGSPSVTCVTTAASGSPYLGGPPLGIDRTVDGYVGVPVPTPHPLGHKPIPWHGTNGLPHQQAVLVLVGREHRLHDAVQ
ncbi:hypothetical protein ACGFMO_18210 [Streptomyces niveus]|uniref:hypothetical protein n=1 Tax=Streptomyces niveus TaxID=193462 RepID=UPI0037124CA9